MATLLSSLLDDRPPAEQMVWLLRLRILIGAVSTAARLGVADAVSETPQTAEAIAAATNCKVDPLFRLLRALSSAGIFQEGPARQFRHTLLSRTLRANEPGALREFAMMYSSKWFVGALDGLDSTIRTGEPCLTQALGMPGYEWLRDHPEEGVIANRAMECFSVAIEHSAIPALQLPDHGTVVDIGGGNGALLAAILNRHGNLRGVLAELPQVVEQARTYLTRERVDDRCLVVAVDMFSEVPAGGDVYVIKRVLHNWKSDKVLQVLANCRAAMGPAARLLIVEGVIPESGPRLFTALGDIQQLGLNGSGDRTESEFLELCEKSRFQVVEIRRPTDLVAIIEARPK